jgi:NAD+ synthase (glutamine-hydrolysing)
MRSPVKLIRVAAAVLNQTPLAWHSNRDNIVAAIEEARRQQTSILCLPELCITGYGCEDAFHAPHVHRDAWTVLESIRDATKEMIVSVGLPVWHQGALFNAAALLVNGEIAGLSAKQNLAGDGIHYEPRWFKPWPADRAVITEQQGGSYTFGDLIYRVGGIAIGFEICEDAWSVTRPGSALANRGVDVILNPSASHFAFGKHQVRRRFVLEGARAFSVTYVYANLVGNEAGRAIYDGDAMIASHGELIGLGPRFSFEPVAVTSAVSDVDRTRLERAKRDSFQPDLEDDEAQVQVPFDYPHIETLPVEPTHQEPWEQSPHEKEEEFTRAISLGLFDYMRKTRSRGFVVSLSGGADSAAVACLVAMALRFALRAMGREQFVKSLSYIDSEVLAAQVGSDDDLDGDLDVATRIVNCLLVCAYQATRNSGDVTYTAAEKLAVALGAEFHRWEIDELVLSYRALIEAAEQRPLTWEQDDITLQNIQARVRAPGIWMMANLRSALLLSTSNRSEAAVGYATMDGDTCGGLSPIAGIDKAFLRHWLRWVETVGVTDLGKIPELKWVNQQAPTAELRPPEATQTDESDLMPYEILDAIERAAIRDKRSPIECVRTIREQFSQFPLDTLGRYVERFFRLWCRNQWKRERYAPSFHVDDENLDPKTWCRFPILSGGFEQELQEMWSYVGDLTNALSTKSKPKS